MEKEATRLITAWNLADFLVAFQEAVSEGYVLDLETNLHFPQMIGSFLTATLVLGEQEEVLEDDTTAEVRETQAPKRGRKPKVESSE